MTQEQFDRLETLLGDAQRALREASSEADAAGEKMVCDVIGSAWALVNLAQALVEPSRPASVRV